MEFITVNLVIANLQVVLIILSSKKRHNFAKLSFFIYKKSLPILINKKIEEKEFLNRLIEKIEKSKEKEGSLIKKYFDFLDWKSEEEILEHIRDYNLLLMPFEGIKGNNLFVRFFISSNLKEEIIAAFGFSYNSFFYIDIYKNLFFKTNLPKTDMIIFERKEKAYDEDYEIKSKSLIINLFEDLYQKEKIISFYSVNYSFLLTLLGYYKTLYSIGYENNIEELYFSLFFYENIKEKKKKIEIKDKELNYLILR
ncbi:MAG TPA: hypothetical protein EYH54_03235 [Nautiliaceae bacterium]|nr:hypothetical protein [Nautiliaceae bacterium]